MILQHVRPLVVDLDGTLIKSDLLHESISQAVLQNPFMVFPMLYWLIFGGIANLKFQLAKRCSLNAATLPFNESLINFLRGEKKSGAYLVLATASHRIYAEKIADYLEIFDLVIATNENINLKGQKKLESLRDLFKQNGFDYIGDAKVDIILWQQAIKKYVVDPTPYLMGKLQSMGGVAGIFTTDRRSLIHGIVKSLRPYQWVKNALIFLPLLTAHKYDEQALLQNSCIAFLIFCLAASAIYLLNDLVDINSDRLHLRKRSRPFASGDVSPLYGFFLIPIILGGAFFAAYSFLNLKFIMLLGCYTILTVLYSFWFKKIAILDVLVLATLYTMRIVGGAAAIQVDVSFWLLTFSLFIFISLAFSKRYEEIRVVKLRKDKDALPGRGYVVGDLEIISAMGVASGYLAVLLLALYIQDPHTSQLYRSPQYIWAAIIPLLLWVSRIWIMAHRGFMHDDPIIFAIKDASSWAILLFFLAIFIIARFY